MKKVAVTGGSGCIGRSLVRMLLDCGYHVNLLIRNPKAITEQNSKRMTLFYGDIGSIDLLKELTSECDVVFHLAGKVHIVPRTSEEEEDFHRINVDGTKNVLDASIFNKVRRIVFFSTVAVYGQDSNFHGDEFAQCNPNSAYAKSKLKAEQFVLNSMNHGGPDGVVLRLPVVYGPGDRGNIARLIKAVRSHLFVFFGDGDAKRSMISSKNAAHVAIKAAFEPMAANKVFCATDGRDYTLNEIIAIISWALGTKWRPIHVPLALAEIVGRIGDLLGRVIGISMPVTSERVRKLAGSLTFSNKEAELVLGYKALETIEGGMRREVEWLSNKVDNRFCSK